MENKKPRHIPNPDGRPKGSQNKVTVQAREAIAAFVEGNVDRLNGWLDQIANGKKEDDGDKWLYKPDPKGAYECFMNVVEYHIPKLARVETKNENKTDLSLSGSIDVSATVLQHLSPEQLQVILDANKNNT